MRLERENICVIAAINKVVFQRFPHYNKIMRDYNKLRAFKLADELVLMVYKATQVFPKEELFGLTSQLRRAAVSIASNIVEGSGRESKSEYIRFLNMAYSSASEVCYQISLAHRLGYIENEFHNELNQKSDETARVLNGLIRSLQKNQKLETRNSNLRPQVSSLKPQA